MSSSDLEKKNLSGKDPGMEDNTAMTIEFLRARLLAERTVSKSARQRADDLTKRVEELEEQLRFVSFQRMRAEKATADVLAILESNGISDVSEAFDSSSDQDTPCESKVGNKPSKEEENSVNSKMRKNDSEELSGSEFEFSPVPSRSLSWKGRRDGASSLERYKDPSFRRRSNVMSSGYSSKHRLGKSCRQIRHKESRSVREEFQGNAVNIDSPGNRVSTKSDVSPAGSVRDVEVGEAKPIVEDQLADSMETEQIASSNGPSHSVYGRDCDMEKALEHQAQLIGQFKEMEEAQREWEEKFRENNSSAPDSCDPGNRSDVTEERFEMQAQAPEPIEITTCQTNGTVSEVEDSSQAQPNGVLSHSPVHGQFLLEQKNNQGHSSESITQDPVFSVPKDEKQQERLGKNEHLSAYESQHHPYSRGSNDSPLTQSEPIFSSNTDSSFSRGNASVRQSERYALVPHKEPKELGGVLEALKQARQSLQQKINRLPLVESGSIGKSLEPSALTLMPGDKADIPVGMAGLFRLPTNFSTEVNTRANFLSATTRLSLGNYYPDRGVLPGVSNQLVTSPYLPGPSFQTENQLLGGQPVEIESRIPSWKPYIDPYMNASFPSSSRATREIYPTYSPNPSYAEMMPQIPSRETFPTSVPSRATAVSRSDHLSFSTDHLMPNMYRY